MIIRPSYLYNADLFSGKMTSSYWDGLKASSRHMATLTKFTPIIPFPTREKFRWKSHSSHLTNSEHSTRHSITELPVKLHSHRRLSMGYFTLLAITVTTNLVPYNIDGLVQDCINSIAITLELLQSCTKPSIYSPFKPLQLMRLSDFIIMRGCQDSHLSNGHQVTSPAVQQSMDTITVIDESWGSKSELIS